MGDYALSKASIARLEGGRPVSLRVLRDLRAACKEALRRMRHLPEVERARLHMGLDSLNQRNTPLNARAVRPEVDPPWSMPLQPISSRLDLEVFAAGLPSFRDPDTVLLRSECWIHPQESYSRGYLSEEEMLETGTRSTPSFFSEPAMKELAQCRSGMHAWLFDLVDRFSPGPDGYVVEILDQRLTRLAKEGIFFSLGMALIQSPEPSHLPRDPVFDPDHWLIALAIAASPVDSITVSHRDPISEVLQLR